MLLYSTLGEAFQRGLELSDANGVGRFGRVVGGGVAYKGFGVAFGEMPRGVEFEDVAGRDNELLRWTLTLRLVTESCGEEPAITLLLRRPVALCSGVET